MEYVIYTYGGGDLLVSMLNAIGMMFSSHSTYLTPVGQIGMAIGIIYAGARALGKGDVTYFLGHFLTPSWIILFVLFSPKTTVWIHDKVAIKAPIKIDNIPFGIAFFSSISSGMSHHVAKLLEETMLPADSYGATDGGLLYGAKAVAKIRDVQIQDPTLLHNTKEYLRQCYMMPYVMGNFGGHRQKAMEATDLLEYLDENPVKCFGIKPTNKDGSIGKFMTCTEAGKMLRPQIIKESQSHELLAQLGASLGISSKFDALMRHRIRSLTTDVFKQLNQQHQDINQWMQQAMILNANRESYDDMREVYGHARVYPELVRMQATRGLFQQSLGSIIGAEMSEAMLPVAVQPIVLALVIMLFVIVLPLMLLPSGWSVMLNGIKLIVWVCSWPVFYTIIHAITMQQLRGAVEGWGTDGLSLLGQAGFTEIIMMKYATAQSLVSATPIISFAVIFGSPYALSGIAASISNVGASTQLGASTADGSLSMKQTSYNNETINQQQTGATLTMGSVFDDGMIRQTSSQGGQYMAITENQDNLITNHVSTDGDVATINQSLNDAKSDLAGLTARSSTLTSTSKTQARDWAESFVNGSTVSEQVSTSDLAAYKNAYTTNESTKKGTNVIDSKSTGTNTHIGADTPPVVTAFTGLKAGTSVNASNNQELRTDMSKEEMQNYNIAMENMKNAAKTGNFTTNNVADQKLGESFGANLMEQEQIGKEISATEQKIKTYSTQVSYLTSNSGTITQNRNADYFQEVMQRHPELSTKAQVLRWEKTHREEAAAIGRDVTFSKNIFDSPDYKAYAERIGADAPNMYAAKSISPDAVKQQYQDNAASVENKAIVKDETGSPKPIREVLTSAVNKADMQYNKGTEQILQNSLNDKERKDVKDLENEKNKSDDSKTKYILDEVEKTQLEHQGIVADSTIARVLDKVGNDTSDVLGIPKVNDKKGKKND